jgi:hypothetical protein
VPVTLTEAYGSAWRLTVGLYRSSTKETKKIEKIEKKKKEKLAKGEVISLRRCAVS